MVPNLNAGCRGVLLLLREIMAFHGSDNRLGMLIGRTPWFRALKR